LRVGGVLDLPAEVEAVRAIGGGKVKPAEAGCCCGGGDCSDCCRLGGNGAPMRRPRAPGLTKPPGEG